MVKTFSKPLTARAIEARARTHSWRDTKRPLGSSSGRLGVNSGRRLTASAVR